MNMSKGGKSKKEKGFGNIIRGQQHCTKCTLSHLNPAVGRKKNLGIPDEQEWTSEFEPRIPRAITGCATTPQNHRLSVEFDIHCFYDSHWIVCRPPFPICVLPRVPKTKSPPTEKVDPFPFEAWHRTMIASSNNRHSIHSNPRSIHNPLRRRSSSRARRDYVRRLVSRISPPMESVAWSMMMT